MTDVRFSMRSLLIVTTVIAIAASALGAFFRQFTAAAQWRLILYWLVLFIAVGVAIAYFSFRRYRAEKKAGAVLFSFVPHSYIFPRSPGRYRWLTGAILICFGPLLWVLGSFLIADMDPYKSLTMWNVGSVYAPVITAIGVTYLWWHSRIKVCDNGVIIHHKLCLWRDLTRWHWDACYRGVIVIEFPNSSRIAAVVAPEEHEPLADLLQKKRSEVEKKS